MAGGVISPGDILSDWFNELIMGQNPVFVHREAFVFPGSFQRILDASNGAIK
jgi:hypothetical protein